MGPVLITDLDNTLYNFVDYFGPCFRAMRSVVAKQLGVPSDTLTADFKRVYTEHGSVEFPFVVQSLSLVKERDEAEQERIVNLARLVFSQQITRVLKPYPGVAETLKWANENKIHVVAWSNAPMRYALHRLKQLGLSRYFYAIVAYEGHETVDVVGSERTRVDIFKIPSAIRRRWLLKERELKPSAAGLFCVARELDLIPQKMFVVGDSVANDLAPGNSVGATGILARYGKEVAAENLATLISVSPWSDEKIKGITEAVNYRPEYEIEDFRELTKILPQHQPQLF